MLIVPVIDIKAGRAVRAVGGKRKNYAPVSAPLCRSDDPADLLEAYLLLHSFPVIYLADLDAITGHGDNRALIASLRSDFGKPIFWLDAGFQTAADIFLYQAIDRLRPVLGTESLASLDAYAAAKAACQTDPILSLDFIGARFLGPRVLLQRPAVWPRDLIVMALDRVGSGGGPCVGDAVGQKGVDEHRIFAAGGVRGVSDLMQLRQRGFHGALVASALLERRIGKTELAASAGD